MKKIYSIKDIGDIKGKYVLLRTDFNVPIKNNKVVDTFRIDTALPTITFLVKKGARVLLVSHLGDGAESLAPIAWYLKKKFPNILHTDEVVGESVISDVESMKNGDILLIGNIRKEIGEIENNKVFALALAGLADIYVNDAFAVSHRKHASITLLPKLLPSYAGLQLMNEITHLQKVTQNPKTPLVAILSGAKFNTKLPLLKQYLKKADHIVVAGALLNSLLKARGYEVGKSLVDDGSVDLSKILKSKKLILPEDVIVEDKEGKSRAVAISQVLSTDTIVDIAPSFITDITPLIQKAKTIVWNGPLGKYEVGYDKATKLLLKTVASSKGYSVIGGGDTVALVSKMKLEKSFGFVSTGGGATIDFLATGTLPGIKVLER